MMLVADTSVASRVEALYHRCVSDLDFGFIAEHIPVGSDDELAELIERDGRTRIARGRAINLDRYLSALPQLTTCPVALDAAIDVALRQLSEDGMSIVEGADALALRYPVLQVPIARAALLSEAITSTSGFANLVHRRTQRMLPADFGPVGVDGVRRYQLMSCLGSGSTSEVFQAVDRQMSGVDFTAFVAIKVLPAFHRGRHNRQALSEEATKARRVQHQNVVRVLDCGTSDQGEQYVVYECVYGGDLESWLEKKGRRPAVAEAVRVVAQIARGVHAAHVSGLVHCDLKPSNVLMGRGNEPKVCDFGIASRAVDEWHGEKQLVGNIAFASPEQHRCEPGSLTPASDIYALGGILFYLLTNELPNGSSVEEVARTHDRLAGRQVVPSVRGRRREVNKDLEAICSKAMAISPSDRYESAAAFAEDLEAWLRREPIVWLEPSMWRVALLAAQRSPCVVADMLVAMCAFLTWAVFVCYPVCVAAGVEDDRVRSDLSCTEDSLAALKQYIAEGWCFDRAAEWEGATGEDTSEALSALTEEPLEQLPNDLLEGREEAAVAQHESEALDGGRR